MVKEVIKVKMVVKELQQTTNLFCSTPCWQINLCRR